MTLRHAAAFAALLLAACSSPAPAPTAASSPVPTPTPVPSPTPRAFVCPLPALPVDHSPCPRLSPQLQDVVNIAIDNVMRARPELFDFNDSIGGTSVRVRDRQRYVDAVIAAIHAQGICAKDDNEEIALKSSNDFNEQFNIWTSGGYTRRAYITTCFPARF